MNEAEYRKLASVEDRLWYFAALHRLIDHELTVSGGGARCPQRAEPTGDSAAAGGPSESALGVTRSTPRVLDAGCGTGGLIARLSRAHPVWRLTGADLSPLACQLARERTSSEIVEASLTALPFPDGYFDAVVSADVLYHIADDDAALRELRRVLCPGGTLIVNVPAHPWLWSYHDEAVAGVRRYRRASLRRQLSAAGFPSSRLTHWNTLLLPLIAARRKLLPPPASGSDVQTHSLPLEILGRSATALERAWLHLAPLPFGSSLFAVAR